MFSLIPSRVEFFYGNCNLSLSILKLQVNEEEASLLDMLWLLLASVIFVPTFQKLPGGEDAL